MEVLFLVPGTGALPSSFRRRVGSRSGSLLPVTPGSVILASQHEQVLQGLRCQPMEIQA